MTHVPRTDVLGQSDWPAFGRSVVLVSNLGRFSLVVAQSTLPRPRGARSLCGRDASRPTLRTVRPGRREAEGVEVFLSTITLEYLNNNLSYYVHFTNRVRTVYHPRVFINSLLSISVSVCTHDESHRSDSTQRFPRMTTFRNSPLPIPPIPLSLPLTSTRRYSMSGRLFPGNVVWLLRLENKLSSLLGNLQNSFSLCNFRHKIFMFAITSFTQCLPFCFILPCHYHLHSVSLLTLMSPCRPCHPYFPPLLKFSELVTCGSLS